MLRPAIIAACIHLTIHCAVSFRAVPKILAVFQQFLQVFGVRVSLPIPHFSTVIRWTLRVGVYLVTRAVTQVREPWICILDHTIQVGTKKALVLLHVPVKALNRPAALTLTDVNVLAISVRDTWNGLCVHEVLQDLFSRVGVPLQVVADGGADLQKGLRLLLNSSDCSFKLTTDITHLIANLLKRKYQHHATFTRLLRHLAQTKKKILQTSLAYLMPLKERSKARFLNLPSIAKWTQQLIAYMSAFRPTSKAQRKHHKLVLAQFSWLLDYHDFLSLFWQEIQLLSVLQHLVKTVGLNDLSYHKACELLQQLPDPALQQPLAHYLKTEFDFTTQASHPTLLTSDVIESLFGKYKYLAKPHSLSEINRMIFALPCICEQMTPELVQDAFSCTTHAQMAQRIQQEISETLLSKRRKALSSRARKNTIHNPPLLSSGEGSLGDPLVLEYHGPKTAGIPLARTG